jgi:hypothetical protein
MSFRARTAVKLSFTIVTHIPDVATLPVDIEFSLNGKLILSLTLAENEPRRIELDLGSARSETDDGNDSDSYELEIRTSRTWQPLPNASVNRDDREISVAIYNFELV